MTGDWGWTYIHGMKVQFSARTYQSTEEARAGLQTYLDAHAGEAAERLRALPDYRTSVHLPGQSWYIHATDHEVRIFAGNTLHTYRRPARRPVAQFSPRRAPRRRIEFPSRSVMNSLVGIGFFAAAALAIFLKATLGVALDSLLARILFFLVWLAVIAGPVVIMNQRKR